MSIYRPKRRGSRVLAIPDLHSPFILPGAFEFVAYIKKEYGCDKIVFLGDEFEHHALGDWDHDPDGYSAGHELKRAIKELQPWYKTYPNASVCTSNHTSRIYRQCFKHGIPVAYIKTYQEWTEAPKGWKWGDRWEVDSVQFIHGDNFSGPQGALKAAEKHRQSTVLAHIHSYAGIQFSATERDLVFGMNAGSLLDKDTYAGAYGKKFPIKPVISCGVVLYGVEPHVITMDLGTQIIQVENKVIQPKRNFELEKLTLEKNKKIIKMDREEILERLKDLRVSFTSKTNTDKLRKLLCDKTNI